MSKNKFKIFNPFYLECHMTLSSGFPKTKHTVYQWVTPNGVILQYVRIPPVETGGYLQKTPTEFGNPGLFTVNSVRRCKLYFV